MSARRRRSAASQAIDRQIRELVASGEWHLERIGAALGITHSTVRYRISQMPDGAQIREAMAAAKPPGAFRGPTAPDLLQPVRDLIASGEHDVARIAAELGVSKGAIYQRISRMPDAEQVAARLKANGPQRDVSTLAETVRSASEGAASIAAIARMLGMRDGEVRQIIDALPDGAEIRARVSRNGNTGTDEERQQVREAAAFAPAVEAIATDTGIPRARVDRIIASLPDADAVRKTLAANAAARRKGRPHRYGAEYEGFGESKTLPEWLRDPRCRVEEGALRRRLRLGIGFEEALTTPPARTGPRAARTDAHPIVVELRRHRREKQIAVAELARTLGTDWTAARLTSYEIGRVRMPVDAAAEVAEALGCGLRIVEAGAPVPDGPVDVRALKKGRKAEVLAHVALGRGPEEIAEQIGITAHTVREYMKYIYEDLDAHTSGQAVALGIARGWIAIEAGPGTS